MKALVALLLLCCTAALAQTGGGGGPAGGGGSTNGTVNNGTSGQIAYYSTTGTAVSGLTSVPVANGGTGSNTANAALAALGSYPCAGATGSYGEFCADNFPSTGCVTNEAVTTTRADCAFYIAYDWVIGNSKSAVLRFGPTRYSKLLQWSLPNATAASISIVGTGNNAQNAQFTTFSQDAAITGPMFIHSPTPDNSPSTTLTLQGFDVTSNGNAQGVIEMDGCLNCIYRDIRIRDTPSGDYPTWSMGNGSLGNGGYSLQNFGYNIQIVSNTVPFTSFVAPTITPNVVGGQVTSYTVANGGSGITSSFTLLFKGWTATSSSPCTTLPTGTINLTGGVITSITPVGLGAGCDPVNTYVSVIPPVVQTNIVRWDNTSDSHFIDFNISGIAQCGIYFANHGGNTFDKLHIVGGANSNFIDSGICSHWGGNVYNEYNMDTIDHYGYKGQNNLGDNAPDVFNSVVKYWASVGAPQAGSIPFYVDTSEIGLAINVGTCGNATGTVGNQPIGYTEYMTQNGPVAASNLTTVYVVDNLHCDGSQVKDSVVGMGTTQTTLNPYTLPAAGISSATATAYSSTPVDIWHDEWNTTTVAHQASKFTLQNYYQTGQNELRFNYDDNSQVSQVGVVVNNAGVATASVNAVSPYFGFNSHYWNGTASAVDTIRLAPSLLTTGANPNWKLTLQHFGSSGTGLLDLSTYLATVQTPALTATQLNVGSNFSVSNAGFVFGAGFTSASGTISGATMTGAKYTTATNCTTSASPACGAAAAGFIAVPAASTTLTVATTAVTNGSEIKLQFTSDPNVGTALGVTCNTTFVNGWTSNRAAATNFQVTVATAPTTNPACFFYTITN